MQCNRLDNPQCHITLLNCNTRIFPPLKGIPIRIRDLSRLCINLQKVHQKYCIEERRQGSSSVTFLIAQQRVLAQDAPIRIIFHFSREFNSLPRPGRSYFATSTFSSPRSWKIRIDMQHWHARIQSRWIRHRTHTINDHMRLNRTIRKLAGRRRAHGITPRRPWDNHLILTLTTIALSVSLIGCGGGGGGGGNVVEECSRGDVELKVLFAPLGRTRTRGDAHRDQPLVRVGVEWWSCGHEWAFTITRRTPPIRERLVSSCHW